MMPEQARHLVDRAMQIATVERTVTCLIIPHDVEELDAVPVPSRKHGTLHSGRGIAKPDIVPATE